MITAIFLIVILLVGMGALVVYKSVGKKGQAVERQAEVTSRGASEGRATGAGED